MADPQFLSFGCGRLPRAREGRAAFLSSPSHTGIETSCMENARKAIRLCRIDERLRRAQLVPPFIPVHLLYDDLTLR